MPLDERSKQVRRDTIALSQANGGYHYGGCFSAVEILIALFDGVLKEEDRFVLSKGHACWPYYVLLREKGFDPKLEGHPSRDEANGIHCTTGSEGHGFPVGVGMAMAKKIRGESGQIYVLMGDGECQEGTTWESMLIAAHHRLDNLTVIVDRNGIQGSGFIKDILPIDNLHEIATSIGWCAWTVDGHDRDLIAQSLNKTFADPKLIIAETVKGKDVGFMENDPAWHAKWLDSEHERIALEELA